MQAVKVDANRSNRNLTGGQPDGAASLRQRRAVLAGNPVLLFFRRQIDFTVAEAKKTREGMPTSTAILARWWISENRPPKKDRTQLGTLMWAGSFECCCAMLDLDVDAERKRLIAEIDDSLVQAIVRHAGDVVYQRKAAVLRCAGVPAAVGRQYVLGLVDEADYEDVADPAEARRVAVAVKREGREAARLTAKRTKRLKAKAV